jgi:hypothetical protein
MSKVKKEGVITVEEAKGTDTEVKVVEGMQFDRGYISAYFITNSDKMEAVLDNPCADHRQEDFYHEDLYARSGTGCTKRPFPAYYRRRRRRRSIGTLVLQAPRHT